MGFFFLPLPKILLPPSHLDNSPECTSLVTSLKWMIPVIPLYRRMGEQDTPTETLSVICTEAGSFVGDLITVLRTKFHVMDGLKKGHTSLIIESSSFWLSLHLAFKWIRFEISLFKGDKKKPQKLNTCRCEELSASLLSMCKETSVPDSSLILSSQPGP